mmetsp:Transcript_33756/g.100509  ORF Transcript_33756/g.100509 Transcript_33756/m.100509 type:complete len:303 (-) Transcript_33756:199-1107(-)
MIETGIEFTPITGLTPCYNQVGGHMSKDQTPESYVDAEGRFYKPFPDDVKALRELAFYRAIYEEPKPGQPRLHAAYPQPDESTDVPPVREPDLADVEGVKQFLPGFYGTKEFEGVKVIAMEDLCKKYTKPCIIDCKMGFTTVYDWASEKYRSRNGLKDMETTQHSCGFRISGLQVFRPGEEQPFKPSRQWGKTLTQETMPSAFEVFASSAVPAKDIYSNEKHGLLPQLRKLKSWFHRQTSFQFYQASVLLMYEGNAACVEDAKAAVHVVDFAYTFQSLGVKDENWIKSLESLIGILESVASR